MESATIKYKNDEITVFWKPKLCIHSAICISDLPSVFDMDREPWINMQGSSTDKIIKVVNKCPSGALTFDYNKKEPMNNNNTDSKGNNNNINVRIIKNGPVIIQSDCTIIDENNKEHITKGMCSICRCGLSKNKPFCDGSHLSV